MTKQKTEFRWYNLIPFWEKVFDNEDCKNFRNKTTNMTITSASISYQLNKLHIDQDYNNK